MRSWSIAVALVSVLLLSGCGTAPAGDEPAAPAPTPSPPAPSPSPSPPPAPSPSPPLPAPAPWQSDGIAPSSVPAAYTEQWRRAENRSRCALLAPVDLGEGAGATPRPATFSGGWAVAYDAPGLRSAFGVAGTGSAAWGEEAEYGWPFSMEWSDGSRAGYGPEGGSGPNELAYLRIAGQECLYNVWSRLGRSHLEHLIEQLRFVDTRGL